MKKIYYLLLLLLPFLFSCEKETDEKQDAAVAIVGKWYWMKQAYKSYSNNELRNEEVYTTFSLDSYFEFTKNGNFVEFSAEQGGREYSGRYRIAENGKKVIIKRDVDTEELICEIRKLDKHQLIIVQTFSSPDNTGIYGETEFTFRK